MSGELPWPFKAGDDNPYPLSHRGTKAWQLVKGTGTYTATQIGPLVELTATGTLSNFNMEAKLVQSPLAVFPPEFALVFLIPETVLPAQKPFSVSASFCSQESIQKITLYDAQGRQEVLVNSVRE